MATRRATKSYETEEEFLKAFEDSLCKETITLDPSSYRGELADSIKLDLRFADKNRIGPIEAQVIFRGEAGVVALRLLDMPPEIQQRYESIKAELFQANASVVDDALQTGLVIRIEEHEAKVSELEAEIAALRKQLELLSQKIEQIDQQGTRVQRGFQLPKYKGMEPVVQGEMAQWTQFWVQIQANQSTGLVLVEVDGVERFVLVQQGTIVAFRADPVIEEETLGQLLLRSAQVDSTSLQSALDEMVSTGHRLGQVLIRKELLTEAQVYGAIHSQLVYVFQKLLMQRTGRFSFYALQSLPEIYPWEAVQPVELLLGRLRQASQTMNPQQLMASLQGVQQHLVQPSAVLRSLKSSFTDDAAEGKWFASIETGTSTVLSMVQAARNESEGLSRFLWMLLQLQLIQFVAPQQQQSPIVQRLQDKLKQIQGGTHFDVLDVHWISTKSEIEAKYQYLMSELNVQGHPQVPPALQAQIPQVLGGVYKAYSSVMDDTARRTYRASIVEGHHIDQAAILLGQQAIQALQKGDKRAAIQCYQKAMELQPTEIKWSQGLREAMKR